MAGADDTATLKMLVEIREGLQQLGAFEKKVEETMRASAADTRLAAEGVGSLDEHFTNLRNTIVAVAGSFVAIKVGQFIRESVAGAAEAEDAYARVQASIEATGGAAHKTADELAATASAIQATTTVGDEEVLGLQNTLLGFTHIIGSTFDRATVDIVDLSAKTRRGVEEVALAVGKALDAPKEGLAGLSRIGIRFSEDQQKVIERLVDTGKSAQAQGIILAELEKRAKGAAEALNDTLGGALKNLKDDWGEVQEAFGEGLGDALITDAGKLSDSLKNIRPFAEDAGKAIGTLLDWGGKVLRFWPALSGAAALAASEVVRNFAAIGAGLQKTLEGLGKLSAMPQLFGVIGAAANIAAGKLKGVVDETVALADGLSATALQRYQEYLAGVAKSGSDVAESLDTAGKKGAAALDPIPPKAEAAGKALVQHLGEGAKKATLDLEDMRKAAEAAVEAAGAGLSGARPSDVASLTAQQKGLQDTVAGLKAQQQQGDLTAEQLAELTAAQDELANVNQTLHNASLDVSRALEAQAQAAQQAVAPMDAGADAAQRYADAGLEIPGSADAAGQSIGQLAEATREARGDMRSGAEVAGQLQTGLQKLGGEAAHLGEQSDRTKDAIAGLSDRQFDAAGAAAEMAKGADKAAESHKTLEERVEALEKRLDEAFGEKSIARVRALAEAIKTDLLPVCQELARCLEATGVN